jgi:hypothetical protein
MTTSSKASARSDAMLPPVSVDRRSFHRKSQTIKTQDTNETEKKRVPVHLI